MNREIKFRAWHKHEKRMVDGDNFLLAKDCNTDDNRWMPMEEKEETFLTNLDLIVMQYTGLKDKNGLEIYEGDIVKLVAGKNEIYIAPVVFNDDEARFDLEHKKGYHGHWGISRNIIEACEYEVIGNIHENPELIPNNQ